VREILSVPGDRVGKARRISAAIRETGGYRWVGIYEVQAEGTRLLAWSGPNEPRDTRSNIVAPIPGTVGSLEVEIPNAFGEEDRSRLEECAALLRPLWG